MAGAALASGTAPGAAGAAPEPVTAEQVDAAATRALRRRRRWALWMACAIALLLPAAGHLLQLESGRRQARLAVDDLAGELTRIAAYDPEGWSYHVGRFTLLETELTDDEPDAAMRIVTSDGRDVFVAGPWDRSRLLMAAQEIFDSGVVVGLVSVQWPTAGLWRRLALSAAVSLLLAGAVYLLVVKIAIGDVRRQIEQLHALRLAAARAGTARTAFLAAMSHEIRTPMNGVIGLAQLLRHTPLNEQQRRHVELLIESGDGLLRIINDILDFSRLESGRDLLETRPTQIEPLYSNVVALMEPMATRKSLRLRLQLEPGVPPCLQLDPDRVRQVLLNLVGNAIKFSEQGEVSVIVQASERGGLRTVVADQGIGMTAEQLQSIFAPFVQADASVARRYGGTGLGLAISRRLARAMGGDLTAKSVLGRGSEFVFELEAATAQPAAAEAPAGHLSGGEPRPDLSALRVLVVDDNEVNVVVATAMLSLLGVRFASADSAEQALDAVRKEPFDVVLMDVELGQISGLDATRQIRALPLARQPTILALTAHVLDEVRAQCEAAGMDGFLSKPLARADLARCLADIQRRRVAGTQAAGAH